jgi:DNA polymerase-3 subunit delta
MSEPKVVLLVGDAHRCERALARREEAIRREAPDVERRVLFADEVDPAALEADFLTPSLFAAARHLVLRRVEAAQRPKSLAALAELDPPPGTFLTLVASELPASSPIAAAATRRGRTEALPKPRGVNLQRDAALLFSERGLVLPPETVREVVERAGEDLLAIEQEAEKLAAFAPGGDAPETAARLVFDAGEGTVYPFLDRLGERNLRSALALLRDLREDPGRTSASLLRHLGRLLAVRALLAAGALPQEIASLLGVAPWLAQRLAAQCVRYTEEELAWALDLGIGLDLKVKEGAARPHDALLELVLSLTSPARPSPGRAPQSRPSPEGAGPGRAPSTSSRRSRSEG